MQAANSDLWGDPLNPTWDPLNSRLRDFTDVGYLGGSVAIPNWPVGVDVTDYGAIPNDGIDDSAAFNAAIAACPNDHAVFVPNGRYTILQRIEPMRDRFVLRGEDMYQTVLFFPKYLNEVEIQEIGIDPNDPDRRSTGAKNGFFHVSGGTHRSIENLTFEFREQMKMGHWERKGAQAIYYGGNAIDSWVRNIYIKNADNAIMMGKAERISMLNIIFDHYIGRPDIIGSSGVNRWVGHIGINLNGAKRCLFHNIQFTGSYFHDFDIINVPSYSVISNITGTKASLHHHGQGANHNLYTNVFVGTGANGTAQGIGMNEIADDRNIRNETHWRIWGDVPLNNADVPLDSVENHVFVGYGDTNPETITPTLWHEKIDPALLEPQNIYLAQLAYRSKPLPEVPPPPPPSPYIGNLIRINAVEDNSVSASSPDTVQNRYSSNRALNGTNYLKFDISEVSLSSIAKARLRIAAKSLNNTPVEVAVSSVTNDSWTAETITYNNRPAAVAQLDTFEALENGSHKIIEFDVTAFVQSEWGAGQNEISFQIEKIGGNGFLSSYRSSNDGYAPELIIEQVASSEPEAPSAPTSMSSTGLIGNVILDWADNPEMDVATYNVYRSTSPKDFNQYGVPIGMGLVTSDFVDIQHSHDEGWDVGMLRSDTVYFYRVTAVDANGYESEASAEFVATTLDPLNSPPAFDNAAFSLPGISARLAYTGDLSVYASDPESNPLYFFKVSGPDWLTIEYDGTLSGTPDLSDVGTNQFTVQVNALGGRHEALITIEVQLPADNPAGAPGVPSGLAATVDNNVVNLSWTANAEADLYAYRIYRSETSLVYGAPLATVTGTASFVDDTVVNGTTYFYVVTAVDYLDLESAFSSQFSAVPADAAPNAPTGLSALAGEARVTLDWNDNSELDFVSYRVYRSTTSGSYGTALANNLSSSAYVDNSAVNGTTYYYVVTAVDATGNQSLVSAEVSATPVNQVPPALTGLVATARDGAVFLDWDESNELDVASYRVYRAASSGGYGAALQTGVTNSYFLDTSVVNGSTYYYVVTAIDTGGLESAESNEDLATPQVGIVSATTFIGSSVSGAADNLISTTANWSSGLPIAQPGTIPVSAHYDSGFTYTDMLILHSGGTLRRSGGLSALALGAGTNWVMDGASAAMSSTRGLSVENATFTLNNGYANLTDNSRDSQVSGALGQITINGGTMTVGRNFTIRNDGSFRITGGTLIVTDAISTPSFASPAGLIEFNGGTTTADQLRFDKPATLAFGGNALGSLTLTVGLGNGYTLNWLPGTRMTMTVASADEWAAAEWDAGRLRYNGQSNTDMGKTWEQVTAVDGLATGVRFIYDSETESFSLESPSASGDLDADGIDDGWENNNFGDTVSSDGTADTDSDGVVDFFEYLSGSNPTLAADSGFRLNAGGTGSSVVFDWEVLDGFDLGTDYLIEVSTDLSNPASWAPLPPEDYSIPSTPTVIEGRVQMELEITGDYGGSVFIRLVKP